VLLNRVPVPRQARMFLIFLVVLAPLFSFGWHWLFVLHPDQIQRKLQREQEERPEAESKPIHPV